MRHEHNLAHIFQVRSSMPSMVQLSQVGHTLQIPPTRSMLIYPRGIILYYLKYYIYIYNFWINTGSSSCTEALNNPPSFDGPLWRCRAGSSRQTTEHIYQVLKMILSQSSQTVNKVPNRGFRSHGGTSKLIQMMTYHFCIEIHRCFLSTFES